MLSKSACAAFLICILVSYFIIQSRNRSLLTPVFYINLDSRVDRKTSVLGQLSSIDKLVSTPVRVPGVPGGAIGCSRAHIAALENGVRLETNFMVVEDDFALKNAHNAETQIRNFWSLCIPWDVLLVSANIKKYQNVIDGLVRVSEAQTTGAYIVHRDYARTLLSNFRSGAKHLAATGDVQRFCIDQHWKLLQPSGYWYSFSPCISYQKAGFSDIELRHVHYASVLNFQVEKPPMQKLVLVAVGPVVRELNDEFRISYEMDDRIQGAYVFFASERRVVARSVADLCRFVRILRGCLPTLRSETWI